MLASTEEPASSARGLPTLGIRDDLTHFGDGLIVRDNTPGFRIGHAARDTLDDFKLALHIGRYGLAGEE